MWPAVCPLYVMTNNYLFTFQPTFTQGLILGQLSILILIGLILRYLFLDSTQYPFETSTYHPRVDNDVLPRKRKLDATIEENAPPDDEQEQATESAEWFNVLLKQVSNSLFACDIPCDFAFLGSRRLPAENTGRSAWD